MDCAKRGVGAIAWNGKVQVRDRAPENLSFPLSQDGGQGYTKKTEPGVFIELGWGKDLQTV